MSHIFINQFKICLKKKSLIFWTLIFPIALGTFFNLAFSNIDESEKFKTIDIAVVNNEKFNENESFKELIRALSTDEEIFNPQYVNLEEAKSLLDNNKIKGYILLEEKIKVFVKENGLSQTIIKSVVDNFYQVGSAVNHIILDKQNLKNLVMEDLNRNYFKDVSNEKVSSIVTYFYTLIGMACLYGGVFGINAVIDSESNLSKKAARVNVSPVHKFKLLLVSLVVALIIQFTENLILLGYLINILKIDFGNQTLPLIILAGAGSFAGISMGVLIGLSNKKSEDTKVGILMSVTMALSFLAGMMINNMRELVDKNIPILGQINPVSMITKALYSLYYYDDLNIYFQNLFSLIIFTFVMITISYIILRRKKYDSI